jgi:two-component sensor histidine kinase
MLNCDPLPGCYDPLLLIEEIRHRVANEYALAISSIELLARDCDDRSRSILARAADRLSDFANVHQFLQPPRRVCQVDLCHYLGTLCAALMRASLADRGLSLTFRESRVPLAAHRAWLVGLILSELITNAVRHARWAQNGGAIEVEVTSSDKNVHCRVSDNGGLTEEPLPARGTHIIEALARELGGCLHSEFGSDGATVLLTFPCEGCQNLDHPQNRRTDVYTPKWSCSHEP